MVTDNRKPVVLRPEDIHDALLTYPERQQIVHKYDALQKELDGADLDDVSYLQCLIELVQRKYREILSLTRQRLCHLDVHGHRILPPDEYLAKLAQLDGRQSVEFNRTLTAPVTFIRQGQPHVVQVDHNLAPFLQRLAVAGYGTGQSDSGTLSDHPNYRYVDDSRRGLYIKGECICFNKQGSSAYLTFWKPDADVVSGIGDVVCSQEQIDDIRRIAKTQGWVVEDTDVFFQPSVRLSLPMTYDGSSKKELLDEAGRLTCQAHPGLYERDFLQWLAARTPIEHRVWAEHGGVVMYTDDMILSRWEKLTAALEQAVKLRVAAVDERRPEDPSLARITDVTIFVGGDGYWRIRCRIDGVRQMSERVADQEMKAVNAGADPRVLAAEKYMDVLSVQPGVGVNGGLKR